MDDLLYAFDGPVGQGVIDHIWVARIARVESQAAVSRLQQMKKHATVAAIVFANKVLQYLKKTATRGLIFRMGVISWYLGDFVIGSVCDASHADEYCEQTGEPDRSQGGRMTILATRSLLDQAECGFHLRACASNTLKRVCRSTLTAEAYQMELGVEAADQLRVAIAGHV